MANGYRDLYLIEKQPNQTFLNVKTEDFGLQISTGNLNSFIMGSSGNFINSGLANSLIFGQGPNKITAGSAVILDSCRSIITGGGAGSIIGGGANGIGSSGDVGISDRFNLIAGGCRNTINTAGSRNIIVGGGVNKIGGGDLYLFTNGAVNSSPLSSRILDDNAIMAGNHNEINGARRSIIFGGYYNTMGRNLESTCECSVLYSNIFNGFCNTMCTSSYSTILNGVYNQIVGPSIPFNTTVDVDLAAPFNNAILNGSYASIRGSGITVINDGRYRGANLSTTFRASYNNNSTIYLDATSGVNIVTGNLRFGNQSLIKFNINNNSGTVFADSTKESVNNFSGPQTLTLDFASGVYISGGLYLNGNQLLISAAGNIFSPTVTAG
jgi:hypothetical protein